MGLECEHKLVTKVVLNVFELDDDFSNTAKVNNVFLLIACIIFLDSRNWRSYTASFHWEQSFLEVVWTELPRSVANEQEVPFCVQCTDENQRSVHLSIDWQRSHLPTPRVILIWHQGQMSLKHMIHNLWIWFKSINYFSNIYNET